MSAAAVYRKLVEDHAAEFGAARLEIIRDKTAPAGDRLKAMEQLESRGLGKPKETIETQAVEIPDDIAAIRAMPYAEKLAAYRQLMSESDN